MSTYHGNVNKKNKAASQLGMSEGKAYSLLRRQITFMLIKEAHRDICHRCGAQILDPFDCTVEHKLPWLDQDPALFWDLENIAFSHKKCNVPHRYPGGRGTPSLRRGSNGTWLCSKCNKFLERDAFTMRPSGTPYSWCRRCRRKA